MSDPKAGRAGPMLFNSIEFIFLFFPALCLLYYGARRLISHQAALLVLNLGSLVFYSWWDIGNLPILLISAVANYCAGLLIVRWRSRWLMAAAIAGNLIALAIFKYLGFFGGVLSQMVGAEMHVPALALPLGVSFYTFQQISFLVDVWTGRTRPRGLMPHILFVAFFPHLIAGPLVQHRQIANQFANATRKDDLWENFGVGLSIFAIGLGKKVLLADALEPYAASVFAGAAHGATPGFLEAWTGALAYSLQIFFDFSAYSDMALGLARCFGYNLPINFNAPYKAVSIVDFWRRWHISLSHFLRDHLYIPLGGNRKGRARRYLNLMITMVLGGLWHGAGWTFIFWGGLHGAMLSVAHFWDGRKWPRPSVVLGKPAMIVVTFLCVTLAWVFFRAPHFNGAATMFAGLFGLAGLGDAPGAAAVGLVALGLGIVWALPDTATLFYDRLDPELLKTAHMATPPAKAPRWKPAAPYAIAAALLLFVCVLNASKTAPFIYFTF